MQKQNLDISEFIEQERKRIQQDAHDKVYNKLSALAKRIEVLSFEPASVSDKLIEISQSICQAVGDMQDIVYDKQSAVLFEQMCSEHYLHYQQLIDFNCQNDCYELLSSQHLWHLQCIVQECLNNAGKHSKAEKINIDLKANDSHLLVQVADDGVGMKQFTNDDLRMSNEKPIGNRKLKIENSGMGLKNLRQRAAALGGKLNLKSSEQGTTVTIKIPLPR